MTCMPAFPTFYEVEQLCKVPSVGDGGAGGYCMEIGSDQQGCYSWTLHLEPGPDGGNCVLGFQIGSRCDHDYPWYVEDEYGDQPEVAKEAGESDFGLAYFSQNDQTLCVSLSKNGWP